MKANKNFYKNDEAEKLSYGGWTNGAGLTLIPDSILRPALEEDGFSERAVFLYGKIVHLSTKLGYCFAKNQYFADLLNRKKRTISGYITELKKEEYIEVEYENTEYGRIRKIYPLRVPGESVKKGGKLKIEKEKNDDDLPSLSEKELEKVVDIWNSAPFVRDAGQEVKPDKLPRVNKINKGSTRYNKLRRRLQQDDFNFKEIVEAMEDQIFLYVDESILDNHNTWGNATFDWLVKNDKNYQKIKEKNYENYGKTQAYKKYKKAQKEKEEGSPGFDPNIAGGG